MEDYHVSYQMYFCMYPEALPNNRVLYGQVYLFSIRNLFYLQEAFYLFDYLDIYHLWIPLLLLILIIYDTHFFNILTTFLNLKTPYISDYKLNH